MLTGNPLESLSLVIWVQMATGLQSAEVEGPQALGTQIIWGFKIFELILT